MPALVMTSRHFFTSSRMRAANASGEPGSGSTPCLAKAARTSGSPRTAVVSRLSRATIAGGVAAGATIAYHNEHS